jgi:formylglycine-generating enzyme required for sulfatase activity
MYGGEISGNTSTAGYGGGVYVTAGGTLYIVTGTIYGSGEDENVKNIGGTSASLWRSTSGGATAQYGTFSGGTWSSNGNLSNIVSETIRVLNGVRQPNFISVSANGFPLLTSTALTLTFNQAIPGLSATDIVLSGVLGVTKGQLSGPSGSGSGPFTYKLPISGFTRDGTLSVSVSKTGYNFGRPRTALIYYSSPYVFMIEHVTIQPRTFMMGGPTTESNRQPYGTDETQHEVTLSGFRMSKFQVTQELYEAVMGTNPSYYSSSGGGASRVAGLNTANFPVEQVSWYDAIVFCNKLSIEFSHTPAYSINGSTDPEDWGTVPTSNNATWNAVQIVAGSTGYRLPTEAQWEYACRAGTTTAYNWGTDTINTSKVNYFALDRTTEVGSYDHNNWVLYDMHGNVWEWCWDWYGDYPKEAQTNPTGPVTGSNRITRGGSIGIAGEHLRSAERDDYSGPSKRNYGIGFRVVLPVINEE